MSELALSRQRVSAEEYLEGERFSEIRHEYVGGYVYAMAGASDDHNRIVGNIFSALHVGLRGKRCEPFMADMKLRMPASEAFYYPDVLLACDLRDNAPFYRERPTMIFEVLSPDTERTDQREKRFAYSLIPSLKVYVIVAQDRPHLTVLRRSRTGAWKESVVEGRANVLRLPELRMEIPLARIYERTLAGRPAGSGR